MGATMDWRAFVHDHAIAVFGVGAAAILIAGMVISVSLPSRAHMLRLAFFLLTLIAIVLSIAVALYGLDLLPTLGIVSRDTMVVSLGCVLAVMIILLWRIGSWWAEQLESELRGHARKLKDANKYVTLTVSSQKPAEARNAKVAHG
jgi:hypothetical protein